MEQIWLGDVPVSVVYSGRRKTLSIFIERDGTVNVLAPDNLDETRIREALAIKEYQIFTKLAKWKELNSSRVKRAFIGGQSFLYLGRSYRLSIEDNPPADLMIRNGHFVLKRSKLSDARRLFIDFYKRRGAQKIAERLELLAPKLSAKPRNIQIIDLQHRWASCTAKGDMNFHWKCIMAPVSILDYIIVHEAVHLIHDNHSPAFWNELDKVMPEYRKHEEWLKRNGVKLSLD